MKNSRLLIPALFFLFVFSLSSCALRPDQRKQLKFEKRYQSPSVYKKRVTQMKAENKGQRAIHKPRKKDIFPKDPY